MQCDTHIRAIPVFKRVFATKADVEQGKAQPVNLVTIWLGKKS